jgi:hypothetical protein
VYKDDNKGQTARQDRLADYFRHKLEEARLVDVEPIKKVPTWRNNMIGEVGIPRGWTGSWYLRIF